MLSRNVIALIACITLCWSAVSKAETYPVNPGDLLQIDVWNEPTLSRQVLVRPDGFISLPMIGDINTTKSSPPVVAKRIAEGLANYMKDVPQVVVSLIKADGNRIFVIGKVARPGTYVISSTIDVMQALALAGGLNSFAAENDILILRRDEAGEQISIPFKYARIKEGHDLETNIVLRSRDIVVVP